MIVYGYKPTSNLDPQVLKVEAVGRLTVDVEMTTVMLLDYFPFCAFFIRVIAHG